MKKIRTILFLILALFFFSKNLFAYAYDISKSVCYAIDIEEQESSEETKEDPLDGEKKSEDWTVNPSRTSLQDDISTLPFCRYQENSFTTPYFEISAPPPELTFIS